MKTKLYVQMIKHGAYGTFEIRVGSTKFQSSEYTTAVDVCERIVDLNIPPVPESLLIAGEVSQIEAAIAAEKKRSVDAIIALEEKRASLLCLENKTEQK